MRIDSQIRRASFFVDSLRDRPIMAPNALSEASTIWIRLPGCQRYRTYRFADDEASQIRIVRISDFEQMRDDGKRACRWTEPSTNRFPALS